MVTHAFVKPGRTHDFVCHLRCVTPALIKAVLTVYGSVERVPMTKDMDADMCTDARAQLERKCDL